MPTSYLPGALWEAATCLLWAVQILWAHLNGRKESKALEAWGALGCFLGWSQFGDIQKAR